MNPGAVPATLENYKLTVRLTSDTQACPPCAKLEIWFHSCSVCVCVYFDSGLYIGGIPQHCV